jgi:hypothetical protein
MASLTMHLSRAAQIIARQARTLAAGWSVQVPPSIHVRTAGDVAEISSGVGPSYPNEVFPVRHPTYGHKPWVTNDHRPFLAPACDMKADAAAEEIAKFIDDVAHDDGFK